jgi:hypothetical protein
VGATLLVAATGLLASPPAGAATTVGQLFPPVNVCQADTFLQTGVGPGVGSYTVQTFGAITSWSFETGLEAVPGLKLKVAKPIAEGIYMIVGESKAGTQNQLSTNKFPADILVEPGDVVGIYTNGGNTQSCGTITGEPGDTYAWAEGDQPVGLVAGYTRSEKALFPVVATVSGPPASALVIPGCSGGSFEGTVAADIGTEPGFGTVPKAMHYTVDGGPEASAKANSSTGIATIKGVPVGAHTLEYWGEDKAGDLEVVHHTASVFVTKEQPKVRVLSDQNKSVYNRGERGSVTIKAEDPHGLTVDPSVVHQPLETAQAGFYSVPAAATNACGNVGKETYTYTVAPIDKRLRFSRAVFAAVKGGTRVSYVASDASTSAFAIYKGITGVRSHGRCVHGKRARGKPCTQFSEEPVGEFTRTSTGGGNSFRFAGVLDGHRLAAGTYRMTVTPVFDGIYGRTISGSFQVVRGR